MGHLVSYRLSLYTFELPSAEALSPLLCPDPFPRSPARRCAQRLVGRLGQALGAHVEFVEDTSRSCDFGADSWKVCVPSFFDKATVPYWCRLLIRFGKLSSRLCCRAGGMLLSALCAGASAPGAGA